MATNFKKIINSSMTKIIVVVLCTILIFGSVFIGGKFLFRMERAGMRIEDLADGDYLHSAGSYYEKQQCAIAELGSVLHLKRETGMTDKNRSFYESQRILDALQEKEGFLYYATDGSNVVSNTNQSDPAYYKGFSSYYLLDEANRTEEVYPETKDGIDRSYLPPLEERAEFMEERAEGSAVQTPDPDMQIYVALTDAYIQNKTAEYQEISGMFSKVLTQLMVAVVLLLFLLVYLFFAAGRRYGEDGVHLLAVDRLWSEVTLTGVIAAPAFTIAGMAAYVSELYELYRSAGLNDNFYWAIFGGIAGIGALVTALFLFSLVRKYKDKRLIRGSFCYKMGRKLFDLMKKLRQAIGQKGSLSFRIILLFVGFEITLLILLVVMLALTGIGWLGFLALAALNVYIILWIGKRTKCLAHILEVMQNIRKGETGEKLEPSDGVLGELADNVNAISEGIRDAVQREVRAERMKAELITNVSHDLKTPLTSIINYADLLAREELEPAFANDYVKIIAQKGEKLKQLTQDLFDISKAQSGNVEVQLENLDIVLLLRQALAEVEDRMREQNLEVIFHEMPEQLFVRGDGRLLSRAVGNLLTNIVKYSMQGTRVYIDLMTQDGKAVITLKNIANYPMNFSEEEIMERFVRGDSARTTEGSGLGLAIAKAYIAACGGTFSVQVDGDLFKAMLTLPVLTYTLG